MAMSTERAWVGGGVRRHFALLGSLAIFATLLALAAAPSQAQTAATTLISNTGQARSTPDTTIGAWWIGTAFTTGNHAGGYTLSEVDLRIGSWNGNSAVFTANIYSTNDDGEPDSELYTLTNPDSPTDNSVNTFTAPTGATLDASTTYVLVLKSSGASKSVSVNATNSDNEDSGAADGWSIGDSRFQSNNQGSNWGTNGRVFMFAVNALEGAVAAPEGTLVSNTGQTVASGFVVAGRSGLDDYKSAQPFTTGDHALGYTLTEIGLAVKGWRGNGSHLTASIYTTTSTGAPDSLLYTLTNPASTTDNAVNTFTAPAGAVLDAHTTYSLVLELTSGKRIDLSHTASIGEDAGAASGWRIRYIRHNKKNQEAWTAATGTLFRISVTATANTDSAPRHSPRRR